MKKAQNNQELFSNYYLEERLPDRDEWKEPEGLEEAYGEISQLYEDRKNILNTTKEAQTEEEWIKPILHLLGFEYIPQPSESIFDTTKVPDYAFFLNEEDKERAYQAAEEDEEELFDFAIAVGDAKRWELNLNNLRPNKQIDEYLRITGTKWGILTNGRLWRIYHLDSSYRLDTYYEVDLVELIEAGDKEKFKYFYLFFRPNSFVEGGFLLEVYERSEDYTASVSEDLKENAFDALQELCQGFLSGNPDLGEEDLDDIYENSLVLLYRLIFLLYAESDEEEKLLPMDNDTYRKNYSLKALKKEAVEDTIDGDSLHSSFHRYWSHLRDLFTVIDNGEENLGVYAYNGGLFDRSKHPFIDEKHSIGDKYVAKAIRKVSYSQAEGGFIDYQDLDVRELGAIYEGLLEHKPVIKEGKVKWEEDLSERKKTGSYYTPEFVVKYIVENTIGPLIEEKKERIKEEINELEKSKKGSIGYDRDVYGEKIKEKRAEVREEILDLKILDPAMGSGHFLVEATEKLANEIAALEEELSLGGGYSKLSDEPKEQDTVKEIKRAIVERSIYGVDKNPLATELAKLSLWLHTVAKEEPLSFLDHHLRTGDSLTGLDIGEMKTMPSEREQMAGLFTSNLVQDLGNAIGHLSLIEEITSGSRDDIQEKKTEWRDVRSWIDKYKKAANVRLSTAFGNEVNDDEYRAVLQAAANDNIESIQDSHFFRNAQAIAEEYSFFHWELEFPDVFRNEKGKKREKGGFDVVIGNPPYIDSEHMVENAPRRRGFWGNSFDYAEGNWDIYCIFIEQAINILVENGRHGFIIPNKLLATNYARTTRKQLSQYQIEKISDFSRIEIFDVDVYPIVLTLQKVSPRKPLKTNKFKLVNDQLNLVRTQSIPFADLDSLGETPWTPILSDSFSLFKKISALEARDVAVEITGGATVSEAYEIKEALIDLDEHNTSEEGFKLVNTGTIERWYSKWGIEETTYIKDQYLKPFVLKKDLKEISERRVKQAESDKLIIAGMGKELKCLIDDGTKLAAKSTSIAKTEKFELYHLAAFLNSKAVSFVLRSLFQDLGLSGGYISIGPPQIREIVGRTVDERLKNLRNYRLKKKTGELRRKSLVREKINLSLLDYLGNYNWGSTLADLASPVKGVKDSVIFETIEDKENLQIGRVTFKTSNDKLLLLTTARYKPQNKQQYEVDRYGYTETDFIPTMELSNTTDIMQALISEFILATADYAGGFANFRKKATKNISLFDRLLKLKLPKLEDVKTGLNKYLEQKEKAKNLEHEIRAAKHQIDAIVFDLYDLDEEEVETILDYLGTSMEDSADIIGKFNQLNN